MSVTPYTPSSSQIVHEARVDFRQRVIQSMIHIVQYDKSLPIIAVELYSNGQKWELPSEANVKVRWGKRDHTYVYLDVLGCNADRTIVYFEIVEQMTVFYGEHNPVLEVTITSDDKTSVACSSYIPFYIDRNPIQRSDIESQVVPSVIDMIEQLEAEVETKQDILESGTNIKTINGQSILGSGNITVSVDLSNYYTKAEVDTLLGSKQATLVSGTNIKTINNQSLLGSGNLTITTDLTNYYNKTETDTLLGAKQATLTMSSVSSGTLDESIGFDSGGNLVRGNASGGSGVTNPLYQHIITLVTEYGGTYVYLTFNFFDSSSTQYTKAQFASKYYGKVFESTGQRYIDVWSQTGLMRFSVGSASGDWSGVNSGNDSITFYPQYFDISLVQAVNVTAQSIIEVYTLSGSTGTMSSVDLAAINSNPEMFVIKYNGNIYHYAYIDISYLYYKVSNISGTTSSVYYVRIDMSTGVWITGSDNLSIGNFYTKTETDNLLSAKQAALVSGTNIKTINSTSLLGSGNITIDKSSIGLGNVNNTSDANKPISTATQTALNNKQDKLIDGSLPGNYLVSILGFDAGGDLTQSGTNSGTPEDVLGFDSQGINIVRGKPTKLGYLTTAPSANNTSGCITIVVLSSDPATKYDGYLYIITGSNA